MCRATNKLPDVRGAGDDAKGDEFAGLGQRTTVVHRSSEGGLVEHDVVGG